MSYDLTGFNFNPTSNFSFSPSLGGNTVPSITDSPYMPTCGDSAVKNGYRDQVAEYANQFGMTVTYWPKKYQFSTHNFIYGEDTTSGFYNARKMKAIINFTQYQSMLSKFGYMSIPEINIMIPISEFEKVWGPSSGKTYPLADDIFLIDDSACDRPLKQSPMVFSVTEKEDKVGTVDFLGGYYVWKLTAKRFDYSYEPNAPEERFLDDESGDVDIFGRLAGGANPPDLSIKTDDVDRFSRANFDNSKTSSGYGQYL